MRVSDCGLASLIASGSVSQVRDVLAYMVLLVYSLLLHLIKIHHLSLKIDPTQLLVSFHDSILKVLEQECKIINL